MPHTIRSVGKRPLDFYDLTRLDKHARECAVTALSPIMVNTFSQLNLDWSLPVNEPDPKLRQALEEWRVQILDPKIGKNQTSDSYHKLLLDICEYCFTTVDVEQRILATQISGVLAILDNQIPKNPEIGREAECLISHLTTGRKLNCILLQEFGECIGRHANMKVDLATANYIWWSWFSFIVSANFKSRTEAILKTLQIPLKQADNAKPDFPSSDLPYFIRNKLGFSEAWALTVFSQRNNHPIPADMWLTIQPDIVHFLNCLSDLMSAPTDILMADHGTYLNYQTQAKRQVSTSGSGFDGLWCFEDTVVDECEKLVQIINRLDSTVSERYKHEYAVDKTSQATKDAEWVRDTWKTFKAGYFGLHFDTPRYNCCEWLPELQRLRLEMCKIVKHA